MIIPHVFFPFNDYQAGCSLLKDFRIGKFKYISHFQRPEIAFLFLHFTMIYLSLI